MSPTVSWLILVVAGVLEAFWAVGLKYTEGFTKLWPSVLVAIAIVASMGLLGVAARHLPISTAYPVWVGIGTLGAVTYGIFVLREPAGALRLLFLALLVIAIIGLKLATPAGGSPQ